MIARITDGGKGVSYNEALSTLEDLTNNFTEMEGAVKVSYEYERSMVTKILKQHYQQVDSVSDEGDMKYQPFRRFVIMYSHPVKDEGMWKYDAYGQERKVQGSEDIMQDSRYLKDDLAWDLLDFVETELRSKIEQDIEEKAERSVPRYYKNMSKDLSQEEIDKIERLRREYALALVDTLLNNFDEAEEY